MFLPDTQLLLNFSDKGRHLFLRNLVLLQNMRVLAIELLCCLVGVGVQHQLLKQNGVHFFLGVRRL